MAMLTQKAKTIICIIAALICCTALVAYIYYSMSNIPPLYIIAENGTRIKAVQGGYDWKTFGTVELADSIAPQDFDYKTESILTTKVGTLLTISNNKSNGFNFRSFTVASLNRYQGNGAQVEIINFEFQDGALMQKAPEVKGEYIYSLRLEYRRGSVDYGFKVIVTDSSGLTDDSADDSDTAYLTDTEFVRPMINHLHTFRFDGTYFTPADDFMLQDTVVSDLDASAYFKIDDLCAYARELTSLSDEQIGQIEAYENTKTVYGSRYICLIDLHDVGIYTFVGWEFSSHTPVSFFTNEPDVTSAVITEG